VLSGQYINLSNKPKIILSINTSWNIYNFRGGLVRALQRAGYEVVAVAPCDDYSRRLVDELGCRYVPLPMDNKGTSPAKDLILFWRFYRILRRERPVAFLGYTIKPNVYGSLAAHALGIPVINNISGLGTAFIKDGLLTRIVKRLYRLALLRSARVFFQNEDDRSLFVRERLVQHDQTDVLPGAGIDLEKFCPRENTDVATHQSPCFLLVARLLWDKGVGEFIEAARLVKQQNPQVKFQLLGFLDVQNKTAVDRKRVDGWVAQGLIDYLGVTDDVRPFIAAADCVVLPSYREGTPRTLLEAAAMGKPLIATDVPGCREVVEHGVNGLLCKVRDGKDLSRRMLEFIELHSGERQKMSIASRTKVEKEFDEKIVVERYLDALSNILETTT